MKEGDVYKFYYPESVLGEGAFGKVLKVVHKGSGLLRAMKVLKRDKLREDSQYNIGRLFEEFSILRELDHPNIIKLYEVFQDEHHWYMIQGGVRAYVLVLFLYINNTFLIKNIK